MIEMQFAVQSQVNPGNMYLHGHVDAPKGRSIFWVSG